MSEQNKIDEIKEATESYLREPSGTKKFVFTANAPEYITYLLAEIERMQQEISTYQAWQPNAWDNSQKLAKYEKAIKDALFNLKVLNHQVVVQQILFDCLYKPGEITE